MGLLTRWDSKLKSTLVIFDQKTWQLLLKQNKRLIEKQAHTGLSHITTSKERKTLDDIGMKFKSNHAEIAKISKTEVLDNYKYNPNRDGG